MHLVGKILIYILALIGLSFIVIFFAVKFKLTNTSGIIDQQSEAFKKLGSTPLSTTTPKWAEGQEWKTLTIAIQKDKESLFKAAHDTDTDPRLIVSVLMVEQLRLFYSNREVFKEVFAPLKVMGSQSQFSWGIMGIKQETAINIEKNLKNQSSPYYLGLKYEHILDFSTKDPDSERFSRMVDEHNHYYSYLYGALNMKEIMNQWQKAGFSIENRPEIIATLYNIGFEHSKPNQYPLVGGAEIDINGQKYSFGGLAAEFYYSKELQDEFPSLSSSSH